jgi:hypothetical protein
VPHTSRRNRVAVAVLPLLRVALGRCTPRAGNRGGGGGVVLVLCEKRQQEGEVLRVAAGLGGAAGVAAAAWAYADAHVKSIRGQGGVRAWLAGPGWVQLFARCQETCSWAPMLCWGVGGGGRCTHVCIDFVCLCLGTPALWAAVCSSLTLLVCMEVGGVAEPPL